MSSTAAKRLVTDLRKLQRDPPPGVSADISGSDMTEWDALMEGPGDTPFEGGLFKLKLQFPKDYPKKAPVVYFYSKMFHPNVYPNGKICLDILEIDEKWSPDYDAAAVLVGIQSMLGDPNPNSPANTQANGLFVNNKREYEKKVKEVVDLSNSQASGARNENFKRISTGDDEDDEGAGLARRFSATRFYYDD